MSKPKNEKVEHLRAISKSILDLKKQKGSPDQLLQAAGRLIEEAFKYEAFNRPEYTTLRNQTKVYKSVESPYISAWAEFVIQLKKHKQLPVSSSYDIFETFPADCELVAIVILEEAEAIEQADIGSEQNKNVETNASPPAPLKYPVIDDQQRPGEEMNNNTNSKRDEKYSADLLPIRDEAVKIITRVGNRFDELLLEKAAKYLILKTIHKNKVSENVPHYFPDVETFVNFVNWLTGSPHEPQGYPDCELGKYCTILFLVYDRCAPEKRLYNRIVGKAWTIIEDWFPGSPLFNLIEDKNPKLEDVLNDCENPPQNNVERIDHLKEYLNSVNAYLDAEGFRIGPETEKQGVAEKVDTSHESLKSGNNQQNEPCTKNEYNRFVLIHGRLNNLMKLQRSSSVEDMDKVNNKQIELDEDVTEFWPTLKKIGLSVGIDISDKFDTLKEIVFNKEIENPYVVMDAPFTIDGKKYDEIQAAEMAKKYDEEKMQPRYDLIRDWDRIMIRLNKCFCVNEEVKSQPAENTGAKAAQQDPQRNPEKPSVETTPPGDNLPIAKKETEQNNKQAKHSFDFRSVHWFGTDYSFTPNQAAAVKILWEAWENKTPDVGGDTLATEVESDSRRARDIFKNNPAFGRMIDKGQTKGTYRLVEPEKK